MVAEPRTITEEEIIARFDPDIGRQCDFLGQGYQGRVHFYEAEGQRLVIKTASGRGVMRWLRVHMLRREFQAYRLIEGVRGSPRCYGLFRNRYLVLQYLEGGSLRNTEIADRARYFDELFSIINELHRRGVAHFDLKRKANLIVQPGSLPGIIDFGLAVIRKPGFAPFNHFLYRLAVQFDFNAWIKHKYRKQVADISPADRAYYCRTRVEKFGRVLKVPYKAAKSLRRFFARL